MEHLVRGSRSLLLMDDVHGIYPASIPPLSATDANRGIMCSPEMSAVFLLVKPRESRILWLKWEKSEVCSCSFWVSLETYCLEQKKAISCCVSSFRIVQHWTCIKNSCSFLFVWAILIMIQCWCNSLPQHFTNRTPWNCQLVIKYSCCRQSLIFRIMFFQIRIIVTNSCSVRCFCIVQSLFTSIPAAAYYP